MNAVMPSTLSSVSKHSAHASVSDRMPSDNVALSATLIVCLILSSATGPSAATRLAIARVSASRRSIGTTQVTKPTS